jgi:hypothetical protein
VVEAVVVAEMVIAATEAVTRIAIAAAATEAETMEEGKLHFQLFIMPH